MDNRLDIIVFGATGFTGKHTLPYLHRLCQKSGKQLTWGIAGRSERKMKEVLREYAQKLGADTLKSIPIIIADVANELSILKMAKNARMIINCCGPYQLYGEVVVKCCVIAGTNYVDVTGELYFQELMESKYTKGAEEKGIYLVAACGLGSIGTEMPLTYLTKSFKGTLNSVEVFMHPLENKVKTGSVFNFGSWATLVNEMREFRSVLALIRSIGLPSLSKISSRCWLRLPFTKNETIGIPHKRILPYPVPDTNVAYRSQNYFCIHDAKRPIKVRHYYLIDSWTNTMLLTFIGLIIIIFNQFQYGRKLLLKYPKVFSAGYFDHQPPTEELTESTEIDMYFYGKGWKESNMKDNQINTPPNKSILGRLHVVNPGYGFTCLAVVLSAITILTERPNLPKKGGFYTPAVVFFKTSLVEEFQKNGVTLETLSVKDL